MVSDGCCGHFESMVYVVVDGGGEVSPQGGFFKQHMH